MNFLGGRVRLNLRRDRGRLGHLLLGGLCTRLFVVYFSVRYG